MKRESLSHFKPFQVKGMIISNHELFHMSQVDLVFFFKMSYLFPCISELLDKYFVGLTARRDSGMLSLNRIFIRLLFLLHGKCLVHLIRFLNGLTFTLLSLHSGLFISYHRLLELFHMGFLFSLQRYFNTFTFLYKGFLFSFDRFSIPFSEVLYLFSKGPLAPFPFFFCTKVSNLSSTGFSIIFPFFL
jgi:hypothetical protein